NAYPMGRWRFTESLPSIQGGLDGRRVSLVRLRAYWPRGPMEENAMPSSSHSPASNPTASLLVDGSALFFGQRAASPDKNLDYTVLLDVMQNHRKDIWP